jgi:hypothetical protein
MLTLCKALDVLDKNLLFQAEVCVGCKSYFFLRTAEAYTILAKLQTALILKRYYHFLMARYISSLVYL